MEIPQISKFKRRGKIAISIEFLAEMPMGVLESLFSKFYPLTIEYQHGGWLEYVGFSPLFDEIKDDDPIPQYVASFTGCELDGMTRQ